MNQLKSCKCGKIPDRKEVIQNNYVNYAYACNFCHIYSKARLFREEAIKEWNKLMEKKK